MAIARNKRTPSAQQAAAIQAFGAAADARPDEAPGTAAPRVAAPRGEEPPKSTLLRWAKNEELRDRIIDYSKRERYSVHDTILTALRIGMEKLDQ